MSSRGFSGQNNTGRVFRLPVVTRSLSAREAAVYLGITPRRLGLLALLGTGPLPEKNGTRKIGYQRDTLDLYISALHEKADISATETARRRAARAPLREETLHALRTNAEHPLPPPDPFMMLASGREVCEHGIYMLIKMLALFGFIMLCISSTPLLRAHFN